ncbi:hypothetical protein NK8_53350 (plasmid) [Caballeronia sp. NK8]|nr:hypothetical protein NK8_53350 [Caballeronia sp. NK8]
MMHVGEAEGQRRFADIGEHVAEERFMRLLIRIEPRLRDQIAERLSRAERIAFSVDDRIDFRMHHIQRRVIADQMMPVQLHEPAAALRFRGDRDSQQRSLREIEALRAGIEVLRQLPVDLRDRHGRLAPDDLSGGAEAIVNEGGAQNVVPVDDALQGIGPGIEPCAAIEGEVRGLQIRIAFRGQHVMEQDAFLQRRECIDILNIGEAAGNLRDNSIDVRLREFDERQHRWRERGAAEGDRIGRHDDIDRGRTAIE